MQPYHLTVPDIIIAPSGDNLVMADTIFTFNCIVTLKIPPLPTEVLVNGQLDEGSRIILNDSPIISQPFIIQQYIFENISIVDNLTSIQCRTFSVSSSGEFVITSQTQARLIVLGGLHVSIN